MGDKVESERSMSGGSQASGSSSDSSSESSEAEEEAMETVRVLGHTLELPQELCENYAVFKEFFSMRTWEALDDKHKDLLKQYLPTFKNNDEEEKENTVRMLLNFEPMQFTSPLEMFYNNLRNGNYRPDIAKMRKFLIRARRKQQRHRMKSYYAKLLPEVLLARERLLAMARSAPPGKMPHMPILPVKKKNNYKSVNARAKQRYFEELAAIKSEVGGGPISDDDNYPEGPPEVATVRRKVMPGQSTDFDVSGTLGGLESQPTSLQCLKNVLAAHRARRMYRDNHPELNTAGITLEDIKQRVALMNGGKKVMFGGHKDKPKLKRGPKKDPDKGTKDKGTKKKEEPQSVETKPLLPNIKIKCEPEQSDSEASSFVDPVTSPEVARKASSDIKQETVDTRYQNVNNFSMDMEPVIKQEPDEMGHSKIHQPVPIKLEDLDGIDMMALPIEIADDSGEVVVNSSDLDPDMALADTTYANFFSLMRALFPAHAAHRASKQQLKARCSAVVNSPKAASNTWYQLSDDWCSELESALDFLAGELWPHPDDFVPYLQYMPDTKMYQWIGAGRDGDATLGRLCARWIQARSPVRNRPPPPKHPTSWVVREPTSSEVAEFRRQERKRFACAAKPYTYVMFGYRSVVGPCARAPSLSSGHGSLLAPDRPCNASLLTLVKDSLARLPNGEGTRHHILTLLKMSQWIAPCSDQTLLNAVSSSLDRLLSAKRDPVVKYDQRAAVWTYLHRNRSEEDWIQKTSGRRGKAAAAKAARDAARDAANALALVSQADTAHSDIVNTPHALELEVSTEEMKEEEICQDIPMDSGSDSEVDVLCSSPPAGAAGQLSSAQLLMRSTGKLNQAPQQSKQKGRLVPVSPQKAKNIIKQAGIKTNLTLTKQSNLVTQAIKQATQLAQTTKQIQKPVAKPQKQPTPKQTVQSPKPSTSTPKPNLMAQSAKQASVISQLTKPPPKQTPPPKPNPVKVPEQSPKQNVFKQQSNPAKQPSNLTKQQSDLIKQQSDIIKQQSDLIKQQESIPVSMQQTPILIEAHVPKPSTPKQSISRVQTNVISQENIEQQNLPKKQTVAKKEKVVFKQESNTVEQETIVDPESYAIPTESYFLQESLGPLQERFVVQKESTVPERNIHQEVFTPKPESFVIQQESIPPKKESFVIQQDSYMPKHETFMLQQEPVVQKQEVVQKQQSNKPTIISNIPIQQIIQIQTSSHQVSKTVTPSQVKIEAPKVQKTVPTIVARRSPLIKQRPLQKQVDIFGNQAPINVPAAPHPQPSKVAVSLQIQHTTSVFSPAQPKLMQPQAQATRSLLIRATNPQHKPATVSTAAAAQPAQTPPSRRGIVRVLSPAASGKSLISPRALMPHAGAATSKKRATHEIPPTVSQVQASSSSVVSAVTTSTTPRTVQLPGGRTVQLAANQTVHLPTGQAVQLQLSSLQLQNLQNLSTHSVRLPSGQTVQLGSPQAVKLNKPKPPTTVQLTGQTIQIGGQTVQIAGQSVQLTGHTVKLPSGQSVQVASSNMQMQRQVQINNLGQIQNVQLPQTVQLGGQTVQLGGQTVQLPGGQTIQLASGQTIQLASGQTVQLGNKNAPKSTIESVPQPVMAKLLANAQMQGMRVVQSRPLLLTAGKPLHHNIILQQGDGNATRVTSTGQTPTSQTIVISNIGAQTAATSTMSTSILKLQQVNPRQQFKLAQGIRLQQAGAPGTSGSVRSVVMDGQQLKLVGGRHVLARILRPPPPPPQ